MPIQLVVCKEASRHLDPKMSGMYIHIVPQPKSITLIGNKPSELKLNNYADI